MIYLLAKMFVLLVLAALLGAWLAHWWLRRRFVDVTRDYARRDGEWLTWRHAISEKLRHPLVDLDPVQNRLAKLEASVHAIKIPEAKDVDLAPVAGRIDSLERAVSAIRIPEPKPVDLQPVQGRLVALEEAVRAIEIPSPKDVDLAPVMERIDSLERAVGAIRIPEPEAVDLQPVQGRMTALEQAVKAIEIPFPKEVDLAPVVGRIDSLERAVSAIRIPEVKSVDLQPVYAQIAALLQAVRAIQIPPATDLTRILEPLAAIDRAVRDIVVPPAIDLRDTHQRLTQLDQSVRAILIPPSTQVDLQPVLDKLALLESRGTAEPAAVPVAAPRSNNVVRAGSRNLLAYAAYGEADNLQLIKGVKSVLEKMLHGIGVYYFWQIAEWTPQDAAHADAQFTAFHGRIERDHWIVQASQFALREGAARKPSEF